MLLFKLGVAKPASVAAAGHRAFRRGRALVVPGWNIRLMVFSVRLAPRWLVRKLSATLNR